MLGWTSVQLQYHGKPPEKLHTSKGSSWARNVGWRVDYVMISGVLRPRLKSATIYKDVLGSDHCPVGIELA